MIRKLLGFSGIALVVSISCMAGAAYLVRHNYGTWTLSNEGRVSHFKQSTSTAPAQKEARKSLAWTGGDRLEVNLPGDVDFTQGKEASVQISGPAALVERVHLDNGRLWLADGPGQEEAFTFTIDKEGFHAREGEDKLRVSITAPDVKAFETSGSGELELRNIDLPALELSLTGSSHISADGHVAKLKLEISGSGQADLADLVANEADIGISGSGSAEINAKDRAAVDVSGSGNVNFSGRPTVVDTSITGSGSVE